MNTPKEFEVLWCKGKKFGNDWFKLTFSQERGFFEPATNKDAEPVIGKITHWQYQEPPLSEF